MINSLDAFMLETLKLSKTLKSSRNDFNVLDNFNVSSTKTAIDSGANEQNKCASNVIAQDLQEYNWKFEWKL